MEVLFMRRINVENLTPKEAWEKFVSTSEEMFCQILDTKC